MSTLVINGADFYANRIPITVKEGWLLTNYTDNATLATRAANVANGGWGLSDQDLLAIRGNYINTIRFKVSAAGDFPILMGASYSAAAIVRNLSLSVEDVGNVVTLTFDRIFVSADDIIAFGKPNGGGFYFGDKSGSSFYSKVPSSPSQNGSLIFPIDVGYII